MERRPENVAALPNRGAGMNKFTAIGRHVIDDAGNTYATDTWHPMPVPPGIEQETGQFVKGGRGGDTGQFWLVRSPIPPLPEPPKTRKNYLRRQGAIPAFVDRFPYVRDVGAL